MNIKEIEKLADLMDTKGLTSLEYTEGDKSIKLGKTVFVTNGVDGRIPPLQDVHKTSDSSDAAVSPDGEQDTENPLLHTVRSPIVGVFYSAPSPESKPFVSLGDRVKEGDVLCVIEAMKMMNEITADIAGEIAELCASNKQIVEFDQPLFKVKAV